MKHLVAIAALGSALLSSGLARASVTYPAELIRRWETETLPVPGPYCTLCHRTDAGGAGTVSTPFGRALMSEGALGNNVPSLDSALDALEAAGSDSDRDGVTDIEELRAGLDPNQGDVAGGADPDPLADVPLPRTGCSFGATNSETSWLVGVALGFALLLRRRRSA
jgi:MYXO-CTERM domain-containing protein